MTRSAAANTNTDAIIQLQDLSVGYSDIVAVEKLTGAFKSHTLNAIVGPNGGGKSTLVKALVGLMSPLSGTFQLQQTLSHKIAYLPQQSKVDRSFPLTVADVVAMGLVQNSGFFRKITDAALINEALEKVGLLDYKSRSIQALSGGQFQKVLFARLWLQQADIIILDEPFSGIDRHTTEDIIKLLTSWTQQGKTVIAVMHHLDLVREHFPETLILARRLIDWGPTSSVLSRENLQKAIEQSRFWETGGRSPSQSTTTLMMVG